MKHILLASLLGWSAILTPTLTTAAPTRAAIHLADDAPTAVRSAIARLYPTAKNVKFGKEDGDYEAEFTHNGKSMSVVLDMKGTVKETETELAIDQLPTTVRAYVARYYAGKKIREAAEIVDANGVKTYEAEVGGKDFMFDRAGKPLR